MKRVFLLTLALILFAPLFTHASVVNRSNTNRITNGLVGYWTFDGKDISGGHAVDRSGNGINGYTINISTSTFYGLGRIGQAFSFDGLDDYVTVGNSINPTAITYSAWIKIKSFPSASFNSIVTRNDNTDTVYTALGVDNSGKLAIFASAGGGEVSYSGSGTFTLATNTWYHVVMTYDSVSGLTGYVNGQVDKNVAAAGSLNTAVRETQIGKDPFAAPTWSGTIDDVRIYNRALSASEVNALYEMGSPSKINRSATQRLTSNLVGAWTFDGADLLTNVADRSGQANHGFLQNFTSTSSAQGLGRVGQGLKFDGVNDWVLLPDSSALQPSSLTISAWINYTGPIPTDTAKVIVGLHQNDILFRVKDSADAHLEATIYNGSTNQVDGGSGTALTRNKWTHVLMTYNGSVAKFWKDGVFITSTAAPTVTWEAAAGVPSIGSLQNGGGQFFPGYIDNMRIYNTVLSTSSIQTIYEMGAPSMANKSTNARSTSSLVGLWSFDGPDMLTNVADRSGQGNNGFMQNFTATSSAQTLGKIGQALKFDGVDDYIKINTTSNLPVYTTSGYSVSFWVKGPAQNQKCIYCEGSASADEPLFLLTGGNADTSKLEVHIRNNAGTNLTTAESNTTVLDNKWHHVVWTDNNGTGKVYIDGVLDSTNFNYTPSATTITTSSIGALNRLSGLSSFFAGSVDNVRTYRKVLSQTEVSGLYNLSQ